MDIERTNPLKLLNMLGEHATPYYYVIGQGLRALALTVAISKRARLVA